MRRERLGDRVAYERLLQELAAYLRGIVSYWLRRWGLNPIESEDVVQEVLLAVHLRRSQWDPDRPLMPWLNAIARYKTIDAVRRLRQASRGRVDLSEEDWSALVALDEAQHAGMTARDIEQLIAALPPGQQAVVRAVGIGGASHKEAAAQLGIKEGAVRVAFHRALKKLVVLAKGY
jgi:RNA polymerase sigma factor (sigma-70 family)